MIAFVRQVLQDESCTSDKVAKPYRLPTTLIGRAILHDRGNRPQSLMFNRPSSVVCSMSTLNTYIVEDSPVILNNLIAALEELSDLRVVGSAGNEADAVRDLSQKNADIDLVIVDVFLTQGSGLGVLTRAQKEEWPSRRVVLTNYATTEMRKRCTDLGADQVFDKSSEIDELIDYCDQLARS